MKKSYNYFKRYNGKYFLVFIFLSSLLLSCEEFLTETPRSSVGGENFFKTAKDADASISAIYSSIKGHYTFNAWYYGDISTEVANNGEGSATLDNGEYTAADPTFRGFWTQMYRTINYANVAIKNIPDITMDTDLKERYVGEARFLRALSYFELVRAFGGVPKITEPTVDDTNNRLPRASVEEIYNLIFDDLEFCETVLPDTYEGTNIGRATRGASKALMAKAYLQKGDFSNALSKSKEVISSGTYELLANLKDVFDITKENGKEHIFSIQFMGGTTEGLGSTLSRQFASRNVEINPNGNGEPSYSAIAAESQFFNSVPNHYRKRLTIVDQFPSPYYPEITATGPAQAGPCCMKFWDPLYTTRIGGDDANWMVIRYADVLLIFAEAENEVNGPTTEAYEAINSIRKRARDENQNNIDEQEEIAELPDLSGLSQDEFRQAVWKERDMELCFEGHHRWDLIRQNRFVEVVNASSIASKVTQTNRLFPIPDLEIMANDVLEQNPGY
ncbi:RagB/SusD family nutrient uptake outer membrane protein [Maribellus maritimus]|uniref:RagB/SusD family nutrient uptake outer membrane protein n=1 Tax=Maribellus maritimus TaxID=2870838 RepID=UPI001EEB718B|nr:RagB/SusD family nutrient uptake outer membrane protein [Maribellus maritimus]MCG6189531.1 RagB/SusD family nutrient uptake outer membrane protein [Maribellus maritimus]